MAMTRGAATKVLDRTLPASLARSATFDTPDTKGLKIELALSDADKQSSKAAVYGIEIERGGVFVPLLEARWQGPTWGAEFENPSIAVIFAAPEGRGRKTSIANAKIRAWVNSRDEIDADVLVTAL